MGAGAGGAGRGAHPSPPTPDLRSCELPALVAASGAAFSPAPLVGDLFPMSDTEPPPSVVLIAGESAHSVIPLPGGASWVRDAAGPSATRTRVREADWGLDDGSGARVGVLGVLQARAVPLTGGTVVVSADERPAGRRALDAGFGVRPVRVTHTEGRIEAGVRLTVVGVADRVPAGAAPSLPGSLRSPDGRVVVLRPPRRGSYHVTTAPLADIVARAEAGAEGAAAAAVGLAVVGGALLAARAVARVFSACQRLLARRAARRARAARAAARGATPSADDGPGGSGGCVVCWREPAAAIYPCGHLACCEPCAKAAGRCPLCRARGGVTRVFFA